MIQIQFLFFRYSIKILSSSKQTFGGNLQHHFLGSFSWKSFKITKRILCKSLVWCSRILIPADMYKICKETPNYLLIIMWHRKELLPWINWNQNMNYWLLIKIWLIPLPFCKNCLGESNNWKESRITIYNIPQLNTVSLSSKFHHRPLPLRLGFESKPNQIK